MKNNEPRLYEFRIKYNAHKEHSEIDNFHYYMAKNAQEAYGFHLYSLEHNHLEAQSISVERKNPWTGMWEKEDY